jgi:hypothetical protein
MECDICGKAGHPSHAMHCITCARSYLEYPRIQLAKTLIDKDGVERHVEAVIRGSEDKTSQHVSLTDSKGGLLVDRHECTNNLNWQRTKTETAEIQERVQLIKEQADRLREQMEATRLQLETKRKANAQRKSDLSSVTYGIESRRANELDKLQQTVKRMEYKSDRIHHDTIELRMQLCTTAAKLAGLKASKRRTKDGSIKDVFNIGPGTRLRIWDLRELNGTSSRCLYLTSILTLARCPSRLLVCVSGCGGPAASAGRCLPWCSSSCRDHPPSQRLSTAHNILSGLLISRKESTLPWIDTCRVFHQ